MDNREIRKYAKCACHLYGVVSMKELSRLIEHYTPEKVKSTQLEKVFASRDETNEELRYGQGLIYSDIFFETIKDASDFHKEYGQFKKYMPSLDMFLNYLPVAYVEQTEALIALKKMLKEMLPEGELYDYLLDRTVENIVFGIQAEIPVEEILEEVIEGLNDSELYFYHGGITDEKQIRQLKTLLNNLKKQTRRITLRGYNEIERQKLGQDD